jgi:hypothetical protein
VAGPRESKKPGIHDLGAPFLKEVMIGVKKEPMARESQVFYVSISKKIDLALELWWERGGTN